MSRPATQLNNQRGAALIAALLAAALVTIMATAMISGQQLDIRRTGNVIHGDQAYLYARGIEEWAVILLGRTKPGEEHEHLGRPLPPMMVTGGQVGGRVDDPQGLFNVNNLVVGDKDWQEFQRAFFGRLLRSCGLNEELGQALADWLDEDQEPRFPGGAEDREYLHRNPPYRTADRLLTDPGEVRLVAGFDAPEFGRCLEPLLSALPQATTLNVNSAPAPLLLGLSEQLDLRDAEQLMAQRPPGGWAGVSEFLQHPILADSGLDGRYLEVTTAYFMVQSDAVIGQSRVVIHSLLARQGEMVQVLRRNR